MPAGQLARFTLAGRGGGWSQGTLSWWLGIGGLDLDFIRVAFAAGSMGTHAPPSSGRSCGCFRKLRRKLLPIMTLVVVLLEAASQRCPFCEGT